MRFSFYFENYPNFICFFTGASQTAGGFKIPEDRESLALLITKLFERAEIIGIRIFAHHLSSILTILRIPERVLAKWGFQMLVYNR